MTKATKYYLKLIMGGIVICLGACATDVKNSVGITPSESPFILDNGLSVDGDVIYLNGNINGDICSPFKFLLNRDTKKLVILNSGGDDSMDAECVARAMISYKIDVEVRGLCFSSCANFLFLAGRNKYIKEGGCVGFNGSFESLINKATHGDLREFVIHLRLSGLTEDKKKIAVQSKLWDETVKSDVEGMGTILKTEQQFFRDVGVKTALFEISNSKDKGVGDQKQRALLIPSPRAFEKFGVKNIIGENPKAYEGFETHYYEPN